MEIRAYDEEYLSLAQRVLGDAFDFAINTLKIDADYFASLFVVSGMAGQIGMGNPKYVAGRTGCEVVREILDKTGAPFIDKPDVMYIDKSPEYWAGWALAYYQWESGRSFESILNTVRLSEIISMYMPYHEMDISSFVEAIKRMMHERRSETRLSYYRKQLGISQSELSKRSGVPMRQIQLFEQRQRQINHTQAESLFRLSKALYCKMEDLLEF